MNPAICLPPLIFQKSPNYDLLSLNAMTRGRSQPLPNPPANGRETSESAAGGATVIASARAEQAPTRWPRTIIIRMPNHKQLTPEMRKKPAFSGTEMQRRSA
jgi:hypothetical protein